jgi:ABC-type dipeptide/oligopeptide/nickel transport system permease subunit
MRHRLRFARTGSGAVGLALLAVVLLLVAFGPFIAPHAPAESLGIPGTSPDGSFPLGTDKLGRDVLSRLLWGGRSVLGLAAAATLASYGAGLLVGVTAGYNRRLEPVLMRGVDVIRAFPPLLFFLIIVTGLGSSVGVLVLGVTVVQAPGIARLGHTATKEVSLRAYVEAAIARGERAFTVIRREILPNILSPLIADAGLRFTFSILLVASVNFLGLGLQPPASDWGLMVSENREILTLNPWAVFAPAALIALLTISVNLVGDSVTRSLGRSQATAR